MAARYLDAGSSFVDKRPKSQRGLVLYNLSFTFMNLHCDPRVRRKRLLHKLKLQGKITTRPAYAAPCQRCKNVMHRYVKSISY